MSLGAISGPMIDAVMLKPKRTAKDRILETMADGKWRSLFEFNLVGVSESAIGARLRETTQIWLTECRVRPGKNFKEWRLRQGQNVEMKMGDTLAGVLQNCELW